MPRLKSIFFHLLIVSLFIGFVVGIRFKPITQSFEFDYDEGFNLMKTLLYSQGFSLYTQIWNDQPPLFTVLLSHWFSLFGQSVLAARLLVLLFSALLVWCFYQILSCQVGLLPALLATLLLFTSWLFIRLSISVMIGIPSLSLAMLSIYFLLFYKEHHQKFFLVLSGIFLALSLQTKFFTVFLIPLMLFYLYDFNIEPIKSERQQGHLFFTLVSWLGSMSFVYIILGFWSGQLFNYEQTFKSHLNQEVAQDMANFNNIEYLHYMLRQDYDYLFLACVGVLAIILRKQRDGIFPLTWFVSAIVILLNHKPLWYHHYQLLAIPICWLAGYGIALLLDLFSQYSKPLNITKLIFPCLTVAVLIVLIFVTPTNPIGQPPRNSEILKLVLHYRNSSHWLFTDRPIYGFYTNLRVPPEIAVFSYKRLNSGGLTSEELLSVLENYRPEQIVLARLTSQIKSDNQLRNYIHQNYSKTYTNANGTEEHYVLSALSN
jgi:4-amino-4-deoxy-L-arabinose transferase-like glycosyltransferase